MPPNRSSQLARSRVPPPEPALEQPAECLLCGKLTGLQRLDCNHSVCRPCRWGHFFNSQPVDVRAEWFMNKNTVAPYANFKSIKICPSFCEDGGTTSRMAVEDTPELTEEVRIELRWIKWQAKIETSQQKEWDLLEKVNHRLCRDLSKEMKTTIENRTLPERNKRNQLYTVKESEMWGMPAQQLILVRIVGADGNDRKSLYIWCKGDDKLSKIIDEIMVSSNGSWYNNESTSRVGFLRREQSPFGILHPYQRLEDVGITHETKLIMKYKCGEKM